MAYWNKDKTVPLAFKRYRLSSFAFKRYQRTQFAELRECPERFSVSV